MTGVGPEGQLLARVRAAPVEGAANAAVLRLLAETLSMPVSAITLEAGQGARLKRVRIEGIRADALTERWPGLAVRDD